MAYGFVRTSVPHDLRGTAPTASTGCGLRARLPSAATSDDLLLFLGDQVYADSTTDEIQKIHPQPARHPRRPGHQLKDYEEYAHLYELASGRTAPTGGCCRTCPPP